MQFPLKGILTLTFSFFLLCLAFPSQTQAKKYDPAMRFIIPGNPGDTGAQEVRIGKIKSPQLPKALLTEVKRTLHRCMKEEVKLNDLNYYSYYSKWNKEKKAPANFIIDYTPLLKKVLTYQSCHVSAPLCTDEGCFLIGYAYSPTGEWEEGFSFRAKSWGIGQYKKHKSGPNLTYFKILKAGKQISTKKKTKKNPDYWELYLWNGQGVSLIPQKKR